MKDHSVWYEVRWDADLRSKRFEDITEARMFALDMIEKDEDEVRIVKIEVV